MLEPALHQQTNLTNGGQGRNGLATLALRAHFVRLSALRASDEPPTRGFSERYSRLPLGDDLNYQAMWIPTRCLGHDKAVFDCRRAGRGLPEYCRNQS
jgi:hypothetical protein